MAMNRCSAEETINLLRRGEVELSGGETIAEACKAIGVTEQTYCRWRREWSGRKTDQAKRLKDLERENARLKKLVADLSLDKAVLQEIASDHF